MEGIRWLIRDNKNTVSATRILRFTYVLHTGQMRNVYDWQNEP